MKMKVEFELDAVDAASLISELQYYAGQSSSPTLNNLLIELQKDTIVASEIANRFFLWLSSYTNAQVHLEAEFGYHLGFAHWWIASDNGLAQLCNLALRDAVAIVGGRYETIYGSDLEDKVKVKDALELLNSKYHEN